MQLDFITKTRNKLTILSYWMVKTGKGFCKFERRTGVALMKAEVSIRAGNSKTKFHDFYVKQSFKTQPSIYTFY